MEPPPKGSPDEYKLMVSYLSKQVMDLQAELAAARQISRSVSPPPPMASLPHIPPSNSVGPSTNPLKQGTNKNLDLSDDVQDLMDTMSQELQSAQQRYTEAEDTVRVLHDDLLHAKHEMKESNERCRVANEELVRARQIMAELKDEARQLKTENESLSRQIAQLQQSERQLQSISESRQRTLYHRSNALKNLRKSSEEHQKSLADAQMHLKHESASCDRLRAQLELSKKQIAATEKQSKQQLSELREQLRTLRAASYTTSEKHSETQRENDSLKQRCVAQQNFITTLSRVLESSAIPLSPSQTTNNTSLLSLVPSLNTSTQSHTQAQAHTHTQAQTHKERKDSVPEGSPRTQRIRKTGGSDLSRLLNAIVSLIQQNQRASTHIASLQDSLHALQQTKESTVVSPRSKAVADASLHELRVECDALRLQLEEMRQLSESQRSQIITHEDSAAAWEQERRQLTQICLEAHQGSLDLTTTTEILNKRIEQLLAENDATRRRLHWLEEEHLNNDSKVKEMTREKALQTARVERLEVERDQLLTFVEQLRSHASDLEEESARLSTVLERCSQQHTDAQHTHQELRNQLARQTQHSALWILEEEERCAYVWSVVEQEKENGSRLQALVDDLQRPAQHSAAKPPLSPRSPGLFPRPPRPPSPSASPRRAPTPPFLPLPEPATGSTSPPQHASTVSTSECPQCTLCKRELATSERQHRDLQLQYADMRRQLHTAKQELLEERRTTQLQTTPLHQQSLTLASQLESAHLEIHRLQSQNAHLEAQYQACIKAHSTQGGASPRNLAGRSPVGRSPVRSTLPIKRASPTPDLDSDPTDSPPLISDPHTSHTHTPTHTHPMHPSSLFPPLSPQPSHPSSPFEPVSSCIALGHNPSLSQQPKPSAVLATFHKWDRNPIIQSSPSPQTMSPTNANGTHIEDGSPGFQWPTPPAFLSVSKDNTPISLVMQSSPTKESTLCLSPCGIIEGGKLEDKLETLPRPALLSKQRLLLGQLADIHAALTSSSSASQGNDKDKDNENGDLSRPLKEQEPTRDETAAQQEILTETEFASLSTQDLLSLIATSRQETQHTQQELQRLLSEFESRSEVMESQQLEIKRLMEERHQLQRDLRVLQETQRYHQGQVEKMNQAHKEHVERLEEQLNSPQRAQQAPSAPLSPLPSPPLSPSSSHTNTSTHTPPHTHAPSLSPPSPLPLPLSRPASPRTQTHTQTSLDSPGRATLISSVHRIKQEKDRLRQQVDCLNLVCEGLKSELEGLRVVHNSEKLSSKGISSRMSLQLHETTRQLDTLRQQLITLTKQKSALEEAYANLEGTNRRLSQELSCSQDTLQTLQSLHNSHAQSESDHLSQYQLHEAKIQHLSQENESLKREKAHFDQVKNALVEKHAKEMRECECEQLSALEQGQREMEGLRKQITASHQQSQSLTTQLTHTQANFLHSEDQCGMAWEDATLCHERYTEMVREYETLKHQHQAHIQQLTSQHTAHTHELTSHQHHLDTQWGHKVKELSLRHVHELDEVKKDCEMKHGLAAMKWDEEARRREEEWGRVKTALERELQAHQQIISRLQTENDQLAHDLNTHITLTDTPTPELHLSVLQWPPHTQTQLQTQSQTHTQHRLEGETHKEIRPISPFGIYPKLEPCSEAEMEQAPLDLPSLPSTPLNSPHPSPKPPRALTHHTSTPHTHSPTHSPTPHTPTDTLCLAPQHHLECQRAMYGYLETIRGLQVRVEECVGELRVCRLQKEQLEKTLHHAETQLQLRSQTLHQVAQAHRDESRIWANERMNLHRVLNTETQRGEEMQSKLEELSWIGQNRCAHLLEDMISTHTRHVNHRETSKAQARETQGMMHEDMRAQLVFCTDALSTQYRQSTHTLNARHESTLRFTESQLTSTQEMCAQMQHEIVQLREAYARDQRSWEETWRQYEVQRDEMGRRGEEREGACLKWKCEVECARMALEDHLSTPQLHLVSQHGVDMLIEDMQSRFRRAFEECRAQHGTELHSLTQTHNQSISQLHTAHTQTLQSLNDTHTHTLQDLTSQHEKQMHLLKRHSETRLQESKAQWERETEVRIEEMVAMRESEKCVFGETLGQTRMLLEKSDELLSEKIQELEEQVRQYHDLKRTHDEMQRSIRTQMHEMQVSLTHSIHHLNSLPLPLTQITQHQHTQGIISGPQPEDGGVCVCQSTVGEMERTVCQVRERVDGCVRVWEEQSRMQLEDFHTHLTQHTQRTSTHTQALQLTTKQRDALEMQCSAKQERLDAAIAALEKSRADLDASQRRVQELTHTHAHTQAQHTQAIQGYEGKIDLLKRQLAEAQTAKELDAKEAQDHISNLQSHLASLRSDYQSTLKQHKSTLQTLTQEHTHTLEARRSLFNETTMRQQTQYENLLRKKAAENGKLRRLLGGVQNAGCGDEMRLRCERLNMLWEDRVSTHTRPVLSPLPNADEFDPPAHPHTPTQAQPHTPTPTPTPTQTQAQTDLHSTADRPLHTDPGNGNGNDALVWSEAQVIESCGLVDMHIRELLKAAPTGPPAPTIPASILTALSPLFHHIHTHAHEHTAICTRNAQMQSDSTHLQRELQSLIPKVSLFESQIHSLVRNDKLVQDALQEKIEHLRIVEGHWAQCILAQESELSAWGQMTVSVRVPGASAPASSHLTFPAHGLSSISEEEDEDDGHDIDSDAIDTPTEGDETERTYSPSPIRHHHRHHPVLSLALDSTSASASASSFRDLSVGSSLTQENHALQSRLEETRHDLHLLNEKYQAVLAQQGRLEETLRGYVQAKQHWDQANEVKLKAQERIEQLERAIRDTESAMRALRDQMESSLCEKDRIISELKKASSPNRLQSSHIEDLERKVKSLALEKGALIRSNLELEAQLQQHVQQQQQHRASPPFSSSPPPPLTLNSLYSMPRSRSPPPRQSSSTPTSPLRFEEGSVESTMNMVEGMDSSHSPEAQSPSPALGCLGSSVSPTTATPEQTQTQTQTQTHVGGPGSYPPRYLKRRPSSFSLAKLPPRQRSLSFSMLRRPRSGSVVSVSTTGAGVAGAPELLKRASSSHLHLNTSTQLQEVDTLSIDAQSLMDWENELEISRVEDELQHELEYLAQDYEELKEAKEKSEREVAHWKEQCDAMQGQVALWEQELKRRERRVGVGVGTEETVLWTNEEMEALRRDLRTARQSAQRWESQHRQMQSDLVSAGQSVAQSSEQIDALKKQLGESEANRDREILALKEQLDQAVRDRDTAQHALTAHTNSTQLHASKTQLLEDKLQHLEAQLTQSNLGQQESHASLIHDLELAQAEIHTLETMNVRLETRIKDHLKEIELIQSERDSLSLRLGEVLEENEQLGQIGLLSEEMHLKEESHQAELAEMTAQYAKLQELYLRAERNYTEAQHTHEQQCEALNKHLHESSFLQEQLTSEKRVYQQRYADLEVLHYTSVQSLQAQLAIAQMSLEDFLSKETTTECLQDHFLALSCELAQTQQQLKREQEMTSSLQHQVAHLETLCVQVQGETTSPLASLVVASPMVPRHWSQGEEEEGNVSMCYSPRPTEEHPQLQGDVDSELSLPLSETLCGDGSIHDIPVSTPLIDTQDKQNTHELHVDDPTQEAHALLDSQSRIQHTLTPSSAPSLHSFQTPTQTPSHSPRSSKSQASIHSQHSESHPTAWTQSTASLSLELENSDTHSSTRTHSETSPVTLPLGSTNEAFSTLAQSPARTHPHSTTSPKSSRSQTSHGSSPRKQNEGNTSHTHSVHSMSPTQAHARAPTHEDTLSSPQRGNVSPTVSPSTPHTHTHTHTHTRTHTRTRTRTRTRGRAPRTRPRSLTEVHPHANTPTHAHPHTRNQSPSSPLSRSHTHHAHTPPHPHTHTHRRTNSSPSLNVAKVPVTHTHPHPQDSSMMTTHQALSLELRNPLVSSRRESVDSIGSDHSVRSAIGIRSIVDGENSDLRSGLPNVEECALAMTPSPSSHRISIEQRLSAVKKHSVDAHQMRRDRRERLSALRHHALRSSAQFQQENARIQAQLRSLSTTTTSSSRSTVKHTHP